MLLFYQGGEKLGPKYLPMIDTLIDETTNTKMQFMSMLVFISLFGDCFVSKSKSKSTSKIKVHSFHNESDKDYYTHSIDTGNKVM